MTSAMAALRIDLSLTSHQVRGIAFLAVNDGAKSTYVTLGSLAQPRKGPGSSSGLYHPTLGIGKRIAEIYNIASHQPFASPVKRR